ncbi:hypothetical protein ACFE04_006571 [Oxalis oulophora]
MAPSIDDNQKPPSKSPSPLDDNKWTRSFRDILVIDLPKSCKQWSVAPHLIPKPKPAPPPKLEAPPPPPSQTRGFSLRPNRQQLRHRFKLPVAKKQSPLQQPRPAELFENPEPESDEDDYNSEEDEYRRFNRHGYGTPRMGYTENHARTYLSSGNPCLDFFFHVVPNTSTYELIQRLRLAWAHDDLTTLRLVYNLRGIRGLGKSDKQGFYTAAFWLYKNHPETLAYNVKSLATDLGCFKDLLEILYMIIEGPDVRRKQKELHMMNKSAAFSRICTSIRNRYYKNCRDKTSVNKKQKGLSRNVRVANAKKKSEMEKVKASNDREEKKVSMTKKILEKYDYDQDFKCLYDSVTDVFAECLISDLQHLGSCELKKLSLAAKWCPSLDSSYDRALLICESIARKVFPQAAYPEYESIEDSHYAYRVRDRLRKEVLVPLRKALQLPEVYIGANRWDLIPYARVASVAMNFYKEKFLKHDEQRFSKYLKDVESGKTTIAAGARLPHDIISSLDDGDEGRVAELQWKRMVSDMLQNGKLINCMAIADVSGSMSGIPMQVAVALGLLVSELSDTPWKGKLITFSANPQLQIIQGSTLEEKASFVKGMDWGMNTDFQKVFDLILEVAVKGKLKPDNMIKRLFVFSDMEFDQACSGPWETDYQCIVRKFTEKGYGNCIPEIVFWNLRSSLATPVSATEKGVALLSGFSKNLLKIFVDRNGIIDPLTIMQHTISGDEYQKLKVID